MQARVWKEDPRGYERGAGCTSVVLRGRAGRTGDEPPEERLLDWEQDAAAIWADFKLYYRKDLRRARMHWWDFLALFTALPEGSVIRGRMSLRAVKLGEIKDPEMRAEYARRKARVRLDGDAPDMDEFYAHIAT